MNEFRRRFGLLIRTARLEKELTQERLAQAMGIDQPGLSRIEKGQMRVPVELAFKLMDHLKIKPETFLKLGRETWKPGPELMHSEAGA